MVSYASVMAVLITPALPALVKVFGVDQSGVQLLMTIFLVGYVMGQLPYGPLGHRYGLKRVIVATSFLTTATAVWLYFGAAMRSYVQVFIGRFFLAVFSSAGLKMAFAYIGECFEKEEMSKISALTTTSFAVGPSVGVVVAGLVTSWYGWHGAYILQIVYAALGLVIFLGLPKEEISHVPMQMGEIVSQFRKHFSSKHIVLPGLIMGVVPAFAYCFATETPFLGIVTLKMSPGDYGIFTLFPSAGMLIGGMLAAYFNQRHRWDLMIRFALIVITILSLGYLGIMIAGWLNVWTLFIPIMLIWIFLPFVQSNAAGYAMGKGENKSYTASVINFLSMTFAFTMVTILAEIPSKVFLLSAVFVALTPFGWLFFTLFKGKLRHES